MYDNVKSCSLKFINISYKDKMIKKNIQLENIFSGIRMKLKLMNSSTVVIQREKQCTLSRVTLFNYFAQLFSVFLVSFRSNR